MSDIAKEERLAEPELVADEKAVPAEEEDAVEGEPEGGTGKTDYVEFLGTDPSVGTEFYGQHGTHSITRAHMKDTHDVDLGVKEVVWKRGKNGRFLVPASDLTSEVVDILIADPMFKLVSI